MKESEIKNIPIRKILEKAGLMFNMQDLKFVIKVLDTEVRRVNDEINALAKLQDSENFVEMITNFMEKQEKM